MRPIVAWSDYSYKAVTGDLTADCHFTLSLKDMTWSKAATVGRFDYPRHVIRLHSLYALITDSNVYLRDGSMITLSELGPRPTSLIEHKIAVQGTTERALWTPPGGAIVDLGLCVTVQYGGFVAANDMLYIFAKFEDLGAR